MPNPYRTRTPIMWKGTHCEVGAPLDLTETEAEMLGSKVEPVEPVEPAVPDVGKAAEEQVTAMQGVLSRLGYTGAADIGDDDESSQPIELVPDEPIDEGPAAEPVPADEKKPTLKDKR